MGKFGWDPKGLSKHRAAGAGSRSPTIGQTIVRGVTSIGEAVEKFFDNLPTGTPKKSVSESLDWYGGSGAGKAKPKPPPTPPKKKKRK